VQKIAGASLSSTSVIGFERILQAEHQKTTAKSLEKMIGHAFAPFFVRNAFVARS